MNKVKSKCCGIKVHLISHAIDLRRVGNITKRKIKTLKTKMKKLLGESLTP